MTGGASPFVRPCLPGRLMLRWQDDIGDFEPIGPFARSDVIEEPDGAMFHEDGSLRLRFAVTRQDGDVLHLFPDGEIRIVATARPAQ